METERTIGWDASIDGGPSGQDWIDALGGEISGTLSWKAKHDEVTGDVPAGETPFSMSIARAGEGAIFVESERVGGGDEERLTCGSSIRLPVTVAFVTDDGALDLELGGRLQASPAQGQPDHSYGAFEFDASHNAGTLQLGVADPGDYENRIASRLIFDLRRDGTSGSIVLEAITPAEDELRSSIAPEFYAQVATFEGLRE